MSSCPWTSLAGGLGGSDGSLRAPLTSTTGPLSLVPQGRPLTGEAVRLSPGRSIEPARADADGGQEDQLLRVTGFPLSQAGSSEQLGLVVFMQLDPSRSPTPADGQPPRVGHRSCTRVTGYEAEDVAGRNCRFLQGPATDATAVAGIGEAVRERRTHTTTLLNTTVTTEAKWPSTSRSTRGSTSRSRPLSASLIPW